MSFWHDWLRGIDRPRDDRRVVVHRHHPARRRILPLYLTKPAMRTALKGLMDTPREWTAFLGYALLAGRKAPGRS